MSTAGKVKMLPVPLGALARQKGSHCSAWLPGKESNQIATLRPRQLWCYHHASHRLHFLCSPHMCGLARQRESSSPSSSRLHLASSALAGSLPGSVCILGKNRAASCSSILSAMDMGLSCVGRSAAKPSYLAGLHVLDLIGAISVA